MKQYKVGYTTGVYDMFHIGHLNILRKAKEQCDYLIVGVTTDELSYKRKNKYPIICEKERVSIVEAIKYVDKVVLQEDMNKIPPVLSYNVDAVFVGTDWKDTESWKIYEAEFSKYNCVVVYLEHTDGISSTILKDKLNI